MHVMAMRLGLAATAAATLSACATTTAPSAGDPANGDAQWAANGWLSPDPVGDPEIIGVFARRADCEAAVEAWKQRQVVGAPISGACLPIDRR